jgi:hypothetical protein
LEVCNCRERMPEELTVREADELFLAKRHGIEN